MKSLEQECLEYLLEHVWTEGEASPGEVRLTRLTGTTNNSYLAEAPGLCPVVIKKLALQNAIIARETERLIIASASAVGLCPRVIREDEQWRVEEYLQGVRCLSPWDLKDQQTVGKVVSKLVQYHKMQVPGLQFHKTMLEDNLTRHFSKQKLSKAIVGWTADQSRVAARVMRQLEPEGLARLMPKGGVVRVCHNDLNPLNILVDPNETFLIDIEYSNYNFVEYDLANFINESHIDYAVEESPFFAEVEPVRPEYVGFVVRKYLEIADLQVDLRNFVENVRKCMALSHLNWACWAILYKKCTVQFDYVRHAEYRIQKFESIASRYL